MHFVNRKEMHIASIILKDFGKKIRIWITFFLPILYEVPSALGRLSKLHKNKKKKKKNDFSYQDQ